MTIRPLTCVQTDPSASCPSPPHLLVCRPVVLITCNGWHEASHCQALAVFTSLSLTLSFLPLWVSPEVCCKPPDWVGPLPWAPKATGCTFVRGPVVLTSLASADPLLCSSADGRLYSLSLNFKTPACDRSSANACWLSESVAIHLFLRQWCQEKATHTFNKTKQKCVWRDRQDGMGWMGTGPSIWTADTLSVGKSWGVGRSWFAVPSPWSGTLCTHAALGD